MASQPGTLPDTTYIEIPSFVRGYHIYKEDWSPAVGDVLLLQRDPLNEKDRNAVAIVRDGSVVGHVPFNLAPLFSHFLRRELNKGTVRITGSRVNRGGGYGLEIPCTYSLYGPAAFLQRVASVVEELRQKNLI